MNSTEETSGLGRPSKKLKAAISFEGKKYRDSLRQDSITDTINGSLSKKVLWRCVGSSLLPMAA